MNPLKGPTNNSTSRIFSVAFIGTDPYNTTERYCITVFENCYFQRWKKIRQSNKVQRLLTSRTPWNETVAWKQEHRRADRSCPSNHPSSIISTSTAWHSERHTNVIVPRTLFIWLSNIYTYFSPICHVWGNENSWVDLLKSEWVENVLSALWLAHFSRLSFLLVCFKFAKRRESASLQCLSAFLEWCPLKCTTCDMQQTYMGKGMALSWMTHVFLSFIRDDSSIPDFTAPTECSWNDVILIY